MVDKLEFYDLLSVVVPGTILVAWVPMCWPELLTIDHPSFPDAFTVILLIALSLAAGQLAQTISSYLEKISDWTFKGKASSLLMKKKLQLVSAELTDRVRAKINLHAGSELSDDSAFLYAQEQARSVAHSRVERFNAIYAFNRNMIGVTLIMIINFCFSMSYGGVEYWPYREVLLGLLGFVLIVQWFRARRRAEYHAREVLVTCETALDGRRK